MEMETRMMATFEDRSTMVQKELDGLRHNLSQAKKNSSGIVQVQEELVRFAAGRVDFLIEKKKECQIEVNTSEEVLKQKKEEVKQAHENEVVCKNSVDEKEKIAISAMSQAFAAQADRL